MANFFNRLRGYYSRGKDALLGKPSTTVTPERYFADAANWHSVVSSNLDAVAYFIDLRKGGTNILAIRFRNSEYWYTGVPIAVWSGLMAAPSKGKFHHQHIKWSYPYRQVK